MKETEKQTVIRIVTPEDAQLLLDIYAPYVLHTAITFEYQVPTVEEFQQRIRKTLTRFPYLAAIQEGKLIGYAYAGTFHDREAYDWAVETSIYVRQDCRGAGAGRMLYQALENVLWEQGILNLNACIAYPQSEDEFLTLDSVHFHSHLGYRMAGRFSQCGYKFNRWYDMVWMEKHIGPHLQDQPPVRSFDQVRAIIAEKYQIQ